MAFPLLAIPMLFGKLLDERRIPLSNSVDVKTQFQAEANNMSLKKSMIIVDNTYKRSMYSGGIEID